MRTDIFKGSFCAFRPPKYMLPDHDESCVADERCYVPAVCVPMGGIEEPGCPIELGGASAIVVGG